MIMVRLNRLIEGLKVIQSYGAMDADIKSIAYDSRCVEDGSLFAAIDGFNQDGNRYIPEAVGKGAKCIVSERSINKSIDKIAWLRVENCRYSLAVISDRFYDHPSGKIDVIGVTGTNGKTTITYLTDAVLSTAKYNTGVIGTISYRYAGEKRPACQTTPEALDLQRLLNEMHSKKIDCCVFEVSSHSLILDRVRGCEFDTGVFTNLGHDHLDFHNTEEDYFKAKLRLFTDYPLKTAVINIDDIYGKRIAELTGADILTYGIKNSADITAADIKTGTGESCFTAKTPCGDVHVRSKLMGIHNVYNILAVICIGISKNIELEDIKIGIEKVDNVPGRFEIIDEGQDFLMAVDYAHTEDALMRVLSMSRDIASSNVITVFGCGGDRDRTKRPLMGKTAATYSDYIIITSDNPRHEAPYKIIEEIEKGVVQVLKDRSKYTILEDRREAIEFAVNKASKGDVVVIAGKGHEDYQIIGDRRIHFDDREVAREALRKRCLH